MGMERIEQTLPTQMTENKDNKESTNCCSKDYVIYKEIKYSRVFIEKVKAVFQPYYENELSDEQALECIYKITKLELLLREINDKNTKRKKEDK